MTYGPGAVYWERFGHNAIWLREPAIGLDHSFNFGFFDFEQENFLLRFLQGKMLYYSAALSASREQSWYRQQGRSIRVQQLKLTSTQYQRLRQHLLTQVQPQNREYPYDYYLDNCSTRLRDALNLALEGELASVWQNQPANLNFRDHTRRSTANDYWYYLGLELFLGRPVDEPITRWRETFLPAVLADSVAATELSDGRGMLVGQEQFLAGERIAPAPVNVPVTWPRYLLAGLLAALVLFAAGRWVSPVLGQGMLLAVLLLCASAGLILVLLAVLTDHFVVSPNLNLLLLNPLWALVLWPRARRWLALMILLGTAVAASVMLLSGWQYNADVLALFGPVLLLAAWQIRRGGHDSTPGVQDPV